MARVIAKQDIAVELPGLLQDLRSGPVEITDGTETVAVLVSALEYASLLQRRGQRALGLPDQLQNTRRIRSQRALAAMNRISDAVDASGASEAELRELERALDRKA